MDTGFYGIDNIALVNGIIICAPPITLAPSEFKYFCHSFSKISLLPCPEIAASATASNQSPN